MFHKSRRTLPVRKKSLPLRVVIVSIPQMTRLIRVNLQFFALFIFFFAAQSTLAQSLSPANIKNIKVQSLTEDDLNKIRAEMQKQKLGMPELENLAIANGMSPTDFATLKARLENSSPQVSQTNVETGTSIAEKPIELDKQAGNKTQEKNFNRLLFGSEIFSNPNSSFDPNNNQAPPANYIMGYGDELQVVVYGLQEFGANAQVNREGKIRIPNVGELHIGGLTFQAATSMIKNACTKIYRTIASGQSSVSVTILKIRTINITVIGSKKPGNYAISSLASLFNALHLAGGPDDNGSYRAIELVRNNKVIKTIDLYGYLTKGDQSGNVNLLDNDLIRIPIYTSRVKVDGKVKRPGIFEMLPNETFEDLLFYCGGFDESAYKATIKLIQNTEKELKISDLTQEQYINYKPTNGDVFKIAVILDRFENRVSIKGAVFRPDDYQLEEGMTVRDLIVKADGLKEDAFKTIAQLYRLREDFTKEIVTLDIGKVLANDPANNIKLNKEDELVISSVFDLKEDYKVGIYGEVRQGGQYPYLENISLFDLIIQAGGFTDAASQHLEISRVIKKDSVLENYIQSSEIINIDLTDGLNDLSKNIKLRPYDVVQIRKMPIYEKLSGVVVSGSVVYPGNYVLANKKEKVLDVLLRSGGPTEDANIKGIRIIRQVDRISTDKVEKVPISIPIDYNRIKRSPGSKKNITLQRGDEIQVLKLSETVKVFGAVQLNSEIPYENGRRLRYYVSAVGGLSDGANKKKIYVVYANGIAKSTKNFVFFKVHPRIDLGAEIVVPYEDKEKKDKISTAELASITGVFGSLAGMTVAIINLLSK